MAPPPEHLAVRRGQGRGHQLRDLDGVEYCRHCGAILALVETMGDTGGFKPTTVLKRLAETAGLPAFAVHYSVALAPGNGRARVAATLVVNADLLLDRNAPIPPPPSSVARRLPAAIRDRGGLLDVPFADIVDTDISSFRVREITATGLLARFLRSANRPAHHLQEWHTLSPAEYARFLVWLRTPPSHRCPAATPAPAARGGAASGRGSSGRAPWRATPR